MNDEGGPSGTATEESACDGLILVSASRIANHKRLDASCSETAVLQAAARSPGTDRRSLRL